jgi:PAS domain S-box-containing protein
MVASSDEILALPARNLRAMVRDLRVHQIELELQNEELRQAQLALAESRDRYSDLYEFAPIGYVTLDRHKRIVESNFAAASMLGTERIDLIGADLSRFVVREYRDSCHQHLQAAFDSHTKQVCELSMCSRSGSPLVVRLESIAEGFAIGKDVRCRTALIDVTETRIAQFQLQKFNGELGRRIDLATADLQRRTEELTRQSAELSLSENHFRTLVNNVPALFAYVDANQRYHYVNHEFVESWGRPASEIVGKTVADILGPKNFEKIRHHIAAALRGEEAVYEVEIEHADGSRTMHVRNMPDRNEKGRVRGFFTLATDITPRKRAEDALREREELLRAILSTATDGIATIDKRGIIMAANPAFEGMFGYASGELIGRNIKVLMPPPYHDAADEKIQSYLETGDAAVIGAWREASGLRKDGSIFPLGLAVSKVEQFGLFAGIVRDITARKDTETKLEQYRRNLQIVASELLLAEERERHRLAEDLHDNLGQAVFRAIMTLDHLPFDDRTVREVREILVDISNVVSALTYELSPIILRQVGLWPALRWLAKNMKQRYGLQIRLKGRDYWDVPLDERVSTVLFRSIREMLVNVAKHAGTDFATVSIRQTRQKLVVSIGDRGKGFEADDKSNQRQLGGHFGLFSVRERLEYIGGNFKIQSAPGSGTKVTLTVPLKV